MLPLFAPVLAWEMDATAQVAAEASVVTGVSRTNGYAMALGGVSGSTSLVLRSPRSYWLFDAGGRYGRAFITTGAAPPPTDISGSLGARADFITSPRTVISFDVDGFLASRIGLRASTELTARDPFLRDRLIYTVGGRVGFTSVPSPRSTFHAEAGYAQIGGLAAISSEGVGVDSHAALASMGYVYEVGRRDRLGPLLTGSFTHFEHALLDVDLTRGEADIATGTLSGAYGHTFSRQIDAQANLGVTVANPPPVVKDASTVVAPDVRLNAVFAGRRFRAMSNYSYAYRSLGPRIGFGYEHAAMLEVSGRPRDGQSFRHVRVSGVARFRHGTAPLAATPTIGVPAGTPVPVGSLNTTAFALGGGVDVPLSLGIMLSGRLDVEYVTARVDPAPPGVNPAPLLRTTLMIALSAIGSTDPGRRLPRDPDADIEARPAQTLQTPGRAAYPAAPREGQVDVEGEPADNAEYDDEY